MTTRRDGRGGIGSGNGVLEEGDGPTYHPTTPAARAGSDFMPAEIRRFERSPGRMKR